MTSMTELDTTREAPLPNWHDVLRYQGRSIVWLAGATGRSVWTLYGYRTGDRPPSREFLERASAALGVRVGA